MRITTEQIRTEFGSFPEALFWIRWLLYYLALVKIVLKVLLPFSATYECAAGLPTLFLMKTKHRSDLRFTLSSASQSINRLAAAKQAQRSQ
jgi:hypothetical protein